MFHHKTQQTWHIKSKNCLLSLAAFARVFASLPLCKLNMDLGCRKVENISDKSKVGADLFIYLLKGVKYNNTGENSLPTAQQNNNNNTAMT